MPVCRSFVFIASCLLASIVFAEGNTAPLSAREIMERANTVDMGDNVAQDFEMILIDQGGNQRSQEARAFRKRMGKGIDRETRTILFFHYPDSVKGMGFFAWDVDDPAEEDKQWLYMPRIGQTKRIAGNDKRLAFMGSDFSHADMAMRNVQNYNYKMIKEDVYNGDKVWVIEATPVNEAVVSEEGYIKSIISVRQDNFMVVHSINTLKQGGREKHLDVSKLEKIDGIWVQTEVVMETRKGGTMLSKTILRTKNVRFRQKKPDEFFTVRSLEQGLQE